VCSFEASEMRELICGALWGKICGLSLQSEFFPHYVESRVEHCARPHFDSCVSRCAACRRFTRLIMLSLPEMGSIFNLRHLSLSVCLSVCLSLSLSLSLSRRVYARNVIIAIVQQKRTATLT